MRNVRALPPRRYGDVHKTCMKGCQKSSVHSSLMQGVVVTTRINKAVRCRNNGVEAQHSPVSHIRLSVISEFQFKK